MAKLGSMPVGSVVKIKENSVDINYIIVHNGLPGDMYDSSCDGVWLLRQQGYSKMVWDSDDKSDYANSDIHAWLNSSFVNIIDEDIRTEIKTVKIPYKKGVGNATTGVQSGSSGLSCKAFLLSLREVDSTEWDNSPDDGEKLSYFSDDDSRLCSDSSGTYVGWHLRTPNLKYSCQLYEVNNSGAICQPVTTTATGHFVRPAFVLPPTLSVNANGAVVLNASPTITGSSSSGSDLGEKSAPFSFTYSVSDDDNDTVTVEEYLDSVLQKSYTASLGSTNTFQATYDEEVFQKILNGSHTLKVIATDSMGNSSAAYEVSFNKQVRTAAISLNEPLPADDVIKAAVISVTGSIPQDASLKVLVTSNALDDEPVWEDMTRDYEKRINHVFANSTAANGFAFNFKVTVTRGVSEEQGYISNIGGAFE